MTKLFNEYLGSASNNVTLKRLVAKYPRYDEVYINMAVRSDVFDYRKWLEQSWKEFEPYADINFTSAFKTQYYQRAWELYLGTLLLRKGYKLEKRRGAGPDFKILSKNKTIWVEAIAVTNGRTEDRVPEIQYGGSFDWPETEMILRITNAINKKYKKYNAVDLKKGIVQHDDPYIISIDRSPLEHIESDMPLLLKCLFGIGHQTFLNSENAGKKTFKEAGWTYRPSINKKNGAKVNLLYFNDKTYEEISAIIYMAKSPLNRSRETTTIGKELTIILNPYAKNPISAGFFHFGKSYIAKNGKIYAIE